MAEFKGLKKDEHEKLVKAARMYTTLTGESLNVSGIPVAEDESQDPKALQKKDEDELKAQAKATAAAEEARQEQRRLKLETERGSGDGEPQEGTPGHPLRTERARERGVEPPKRDGKAADTKAADKK